MGVMGRSPRTILKKGEKTMWISKKKWEDVNDKLQSANDKIANLEERIKEQGEEYDRLLYLHGEAEPKVEPCMSIACRDCKYAVIEQSFGWNVLKGCGRNRICEHFERAR